MDQKNIIRTVVLAYFALLMSACASSPANSLSELKSRAPDAYTGEVKSIIVPRSYPSVVNEVAKRIDSCLSFSLKWSDQHGAQEKWKHQPKMVKLGKDSTRMYLETTYTDYGIFSDDVSTQYNYMIDIMKVSERKTKVTSYTINYDLWNETILDYLQGDKTAFCPNDEKTEPKDSGFDYIGLWKPALLLYLLSTF